MNPHQTPLTIPDDSFPRHFVFWPRPKQVWLQLLVLFGILASLAALLYVGDGARWISVPVLIGGVSVLFIGIAAGYMIWFRRSAPRAVVACDEFLGVVDRAGGQQRIPWSSIFLAQHSVRYLGMQWELDLVPEGRVVLHDVGIAPDRWGILRAIIIHCAGAGGAAVFVDQISETVYPGQ